MEKTLIDYPDILGSLTQAVTVKKITVTEANKIQKAFPDKVLPSHRVDISGRVYFGDSHYGSFQIRFIRREGVIQLYDRDFSKSLVEFQDKLRRRNKQIRDLRESLTAKK